MSFDFSSMDPLGGRNRPTPSSKMTNEKKMENLNPFGESEQNILRQVDMISQLQVKAFLSSMEIELKYPNVIEPDRKKNDQDNPSTTDTNGPSEADNEYSSMSQAFREKEQAISKLIEHMESISHQINQLSLEMK